MADVQEYIILLLIWLVPSILIRILFKSRTFHLRPPSPLALPIIGHLHLLRPIPHQALHELSKRYGPLIHLSLGSFPCVVVSSPEMAEEFLKTHENSFSNRPPRAIIEYITFGSKGLVFAPYGAYWKLMKKLCMSELLGGRNLDLLLPVRRDEITRFIKLLSLKAKAGEAVHIGADLTRLTNSMMSRMITRQRCPEKEDEAGNLRETVQEIIDLSGKFNISDFNGFCKKLDLQGFKKRARLLGEKFDAMMEKIIEEHQETKRIHKKNNDGCGKVKDMIDVLLDLSEDESSDIRPTIDNIKALILEMFGGGTETSAITLEWALSELINHPNVMQKAIQEIDSIIGKNRLVDESDITSLPYLQAIVRETMRLHPAGPMIARESSEDCEIGGYYIPAKTRLLVNVWAIGRDPNYWENPLEFRPERFLGEERDGNKSKLDVRGQHFQLLPFGSGRRLCPGASLALQVIHTSLAAMLQCFEWKVKGEGNGKVNMEEARGLALPKAHPLLCFPVARLNPLPMSI